MSNKLDKEIARINAIMDRIDLDFVEAAHYERDRSYRLDAPAQVPMAKDNPLGLPSIEFYAPTTVSVLAYPVLYCLHHNEDHACMYTHKVDSTMGACAAAYEQVNRKDAYVPSERVQTTAERSIGGSLTRS